MKQAKGTAYLTHRVSNTNRSLLVSSICLHFNVLFDCTLGTLEVNFNITSWKSCAETDSRRLANGIDAAMDSMKRLLEDNLRLIEARC